MQQLTHTHQQADAIQQLKERIFDKRTELRSYWDKRRPSQKHHTVPVSLWAEGLNSVLGLGNGGILNCISIRLSLMFVVFFSVH